MGYKANIYILSSSIVWSACFQMPSKSVGSVKVLDGTPRLTQAHQISETKSVTTVDPNAKAAQTLLAPSNGSLSGSSITLQPGTLSIAVDLVVEEAAPFAELSLLQNIGLSEDPEVTTVGSGLIIRPSEAAALSGQLVINMQVPAATGLMLQSTTSIVVFYQQYVGTSLMTGVIPTQDITFKDDGSCSFKGYFGAYWVARVAKPIEKAVAAPSAEPIINAQKVAVIRESGVVKESEVVAKASVPEVSWTSVSASFDEPTRAISLVAQASSSSLSACRADFFTSPGAFSGVELLTGSELKANWVISSTEAQTLYGRFRCTDSEGRRAVSPWSTAVTIPAKALHSEKDGEVQKPGSLPATAIFSSLSPAAEASDTIVNASEKDGTAPLWALHASAYSTAAFTLPLRVDAGDVSCDEKQSYSEASIPGANHLGTDGPYLICAELSDAQGGKTYGKSSVIVRDTIPPTFLALSRVNAAADGLIKNGEILLVNPLWALSVSDAASTTFTNALLYDASLSCSSAQTYSQASLPTPASLTVDGSYVVCARMVDNAGNIAYGMSDIVVRDTISSVNLQAANEAADHVINAAEATSSLALVSLSASGHDSALFTTALPASSVSDCDSSFSYSTVVPQVNSIGVDGSYVVCAKISDAAGNILYQKSATISKDATPPIFSSLVKTAEASDGVINSLEASATQALWILTASSASSIAYSQALSDAGGTQVCDSADSYNQGSTIPRASDLASDGDWTLCVKLTDAVGNVAFGKGELIVRNTAEPTAVVPSLSGDSFINQSEAGSSAPLWSLPTLSGVTVSYTLPLSDSGSSLVCDATQSYTLSTLPTATDINSDGTYAICIKTLNSFGNAAYAKAPAVVRDTTPPSFSTLNLINEADDSYINDSEKNSSVVPVSLIASDYVQHDYSSAQPSGTTCSAALTYGPLLPISNITSDGVFIFCVRLTDSAGNVSYGGSPNLTRDTAAPTVVSISLASILTDGYLNAAEYTGASTSLTFVSASGHDNVHYAVVNAAVNCSSGPSYTATQALSNSSDFGSDGVYKVCVRLQDLALNEAIGESSAFKLDRTPPSFSGIKDLAPRGSGTAAMLYWKVATDNQTPSENLIYEICYGAPGSCSASFSPMVNIGPNRWNEEITGLTAGSAYEFMVRAKDAAGNRDNNSHVLSNISLNGALAVAAGPGHSCALLSGGSVACWGRNSYGQLGNNSTINSSRPVAVSGLSGATAVAVGENHSCALLSDQSVQCWGYNGYGQLGDSTTTSRTQSVSVTSLGSVTALSLGQNHSCALLSDQTVKCWGANASRQLGDGSSLTRSSPVSVASLSGVVGIATGAEHSCAILSDATAVCWGKNATGQIGDGSTTLAAAPQVVSGIANIIQLAAGMNQTCARHSDGTVTCWGYNANGQLGNGSMSQSLVPVHVRTSSADSANLNTAVELSAGYNHSCAKLSDGSVKCWGWNGFGQLGSETTFQTPSPVTIPTLHGSTSLGLGQYHSCAVLSGQIKCWGTNENGLLGQGTGDIMNPPAVLSDLSGTTKVALGDFHGCALDSGGSVWCWGQSKYGQIGRNLIELAPSSVVAVHTASGNPAQLTGASDIDLGHNHSCALVGSTIKCWGANSMGQLGDGTNSDKLTPVSVSSISDAAQISTGGEHTCAKLSTGYLKCWGNNSSGQLGNGGTTPSPTPTSVSTLSSVTSIATGGFHTCAIDSAGDVWCWGSNVYGQLGLGDTTTRSSPTQVPGLSNVTALALGRFHSCAKLSDGSLSCWGSNSSGALGDNTVTNRLSPVAISFSSELESLALGENFSCAKSTETNNPLTCWGANNYSQTALNTASSVPTVVPGLRQVSQVAAGKTSACAVLGDGSVSCWGSSREGQGGAAKPFSSNPAELVLGY